MITIIVLGQQGAPITVKWAAERAARDMRRTGRTVSMFTDDEARPERIAAHLDYRVTTSILPNILVVGLPYEAPDSQVQAILTAVRTYTNPKKESTT